MEEPNAKRGWEIDQHKIGALAAKQAALHIVQGRPFEAGIALAASIIREDDRRRAAARRVRL